MYIFKVSETFIIFFFIFPGMVQEIILIINSKGLDQTAFLLLTSFLSVLVFDQSLG